MTEYIQQERSNNPGIVSYPSKYSVSFSIRNLLTQTRKAECNIDFSLLSPKYIMSLYNNNQFKKTHQNQLSHALRRKTQHIPPISAKSNFLVEQTMEDRWEVGAAIAFIVIDRHYAHFSLSQTEAATSRRTALEGGGGLIASPPHALQTVPTSGTFSPSAN